MKISTPYQVKNKSSIHNIKKTDNEISELSIKFFRESARVRQPRKGAHQMCQCLQRMIIETYFPEQMSNISKKEKN